MAFLVILRETLRNQDSSRLECHTLAITFTFQPRIRKDITKRSGATFLRKPNILVESGSKSAYKHVHGE